MASRESLLIVDCWAAVRGMASALPFAGGLMDQPAALYEAFSVVSEVDAAVQKAGRLIDPRKS